MTALCDCLGLIANLTGNQADPRVLVLPLANQLRAIGHEPGNWVRHLEVGSNKAINVVT
jgi:hypothetical protein